MSIVNKKAFADYQILDKFEAGINLLGSEVKAVKEGHADLIGSYVRIMGSEAYLINAKIFPYKYSRADSYEESRSRKLLLHKKEIISLKSKMEGEHLNLVPIAFYVKNNFIKLEIALGKSRKKYDKRELLKQKDLQRDLNRKLS